MFTKDIEEHVSAPQALSGTPYYFPVVQKWLIYDGGSSKKKWKSYISAPVDRVSLLSILLRVGRGDE
eukprot:4049042-Prorocentrum_lima.AAC.1